MVSSDSMGSESDPAAAAAEKRTGRGGGGGGGEEEEGRKAKHEASFAEMKNRLKSRS